MRVVNKLTQPGDIRRVDLSSDIVRIQTADGQERVYRLSTETESRVRIETQKSEINEQSA